MHWVLDKGLDALSGDFRVTLHHHENPSYVAGHGTCQFECFHDDGSPAHAGCEAEFTVDFEGVSFTRIEFTADNLTGPILQAFTTSALRRDILDYLNERYPVEADQGPAPISNEVLRKSWPNGPDFDQLLVMVMVYYNQAVRRERPGTMAVADRFQVSRATASRMVAKARENGLKLVEPVPYPGKRTDNDGTKETKGRRAGDD